MIAMATQAPVFAHIAIDGKIHPTLGIRVVPGQFKAGAVMTWTTKTGRSEQLVVEKLEQDATGRWVLSLTNLL